MSTPKELFRVPILPLPSHQGGSIICTEPQLQVYLLTFSSAPDNRLTPAFCAAMLTALDLIEFEHPSGVLVTTSAIPKFYSNGLDLELAMTTPGFTGNSLYPLFRRLLTFPMPTVALVNGHAFAGGLMLAMHHDYRIFAGTRGYLCINELEFGVPLLPPMSGIFRAKLRPDVYRHLVLEARRWDAKAALEAGLVDSVDGMEGVAKMIKERTLVAKGKKGVYGMLKEEMYREQVALLDAKVMNIQEVMAIDQKRKKGKARTEKAKF